MSYRVRVAVPFILHYEVKVENAKSPEDASAEARKRIPRVRFEDGPLEWSRSFLDIRYFEPVEDHATVEVEERK